MTLRLPKGYVLETEEGTLPEIHHIWRRRPSSLARDVSLAIVAGPLRMTYCPGGPPHHSSSTPTWKGRWRHCASSIPGVPIREAFLESSPGAIVHLAIIGPPGPEADSLQTIAESLKVP